MGKKGQVARDRRATRLQRMVGVSKIFVRGEAMGSEPIRLGGHAVDGQRDGRVGGNGGKVEQSFRRTRKNHLIIK